MKKKYVKPIAAIEYFTLSQSIAQSCGYKDEDYFGKPTHQEMSICGWQEVDGTIIWLSKPTCSDAYSPDVEISEGCYNAPSGMNQIFAS